jgi:predicted nucleic acid-binding protein
MVHPTNPEQVRPTLRAIWRTSARSGIGAPGLCYIDRGSSLQRPCTYGTNILAKTRLIGRRIKTQSRAVRATAGMIVDASVWVAMFRESDVHHGASVAFLDLAVANQQDLDVPNLALAEIAGVFARQTGKATLATRTIRAVLVLPRVQRHGLNDALGDRAAALAASCKLRGADAVCRTRRSTRSTTDHVGPGDSGTAISGHRSRSGRCVGESPVKRVIVAVLSRISGG